jgi:DNA-binding NarL/FixJ family response regulator
MKEPRVLLVDAPAPTRVLLRSSLEGAEFSVCAEATDAEAAVVLARDERPDVVLIEIRLPGNGLRAVAEIAGLLPDTFIVMLTDSHDHDDLVAAVRLGACGYLDKGMVFDRIPHVLRAVISGEFALPRSFVGQLIQELRDRRAPGRLRLTGDGAVRLTDREWEVLDLLRDGLQTVQIADRLFVSQVTVRGHVAAIVKKLRVPDRAAAIELVEAMDVRDDPEV